MLSIEKLTFTFPENGITAVDEVSLQFEPGKIHALLGENGAGKSTLARLCTGHLQPDSGLMRYNNELLALQSAADGIRQGLVLVPQHPQLSAELTVWENLVIGLHTAKQLSASVVVPARTAAAVQEALAVYGISLPLAQKAGTLDTSQLHWAAIGEALLKKPTVFCLDEPSASFSPQEITQLYGILRRLADQGVCVIVVTHRIQEVLAFMNTVHILRNGKTVRSCPITPGITAETLLEDIFGSKAVEDAEVHTSEVCSAKPSSAEGLELSHIAAVNGKGIRFLDFSLAAPCGSITGVVGIKKQGLELLEYVLVNTITPDRGTLTFNGQPLTHIPRKDYAYIPSKRMRNGIADRYSIAKNLYIRARALLYRYGIFSKKAVTAWQRRCSFDIPRSWNDSVLSLSGGMIQKLIFSRELDNPEPKLVICAEPYWGLDRKVQLVLLQRLRTLATNGAAVIVLTSDADAALETCDRIHVLYRGAVIRCMERSAYNRSALITAMMQATAHE